MWDGNSWSALGSGVGGSFPNNFSSVYALAFSGTNLYAGGIFSTADGITATNIAMWDGNSWSALPGMNIASLSLQYGLGGVCALAVSGTNLYAGGAFMTSVSVYIARWTGSNWSDLNPGLNGHVAALAMSGTNLYAGGFFDTADGLPANGIAMLNGNDWSCLLYTSRCV